MFLSSDYTRWLNRISEKLICEYFLSISCLLEIFKIVIHDSNLAIGVYYAPIVCFLTTKEGNDDSIRFDSIFDDCSRLVHEILLMANKDQINSK